jgi:hypothetical protein
MAAGSDYGLVLWQQGQWQHFPYPKGARREGRRVESMAWHDGALYVATQKNWYRWPFSGEAVGRGFERDAYGVVIELRTFHSGPKGLLRAWQDRLEGGVGPGDIICFVNSPLGVFAGTLDGQLWRIDQGLLRRFERNGRPAPVRYLAWAHNRLWVASAGALHTWDGQAWEQREGEPYSLHSGTDGALWALRQGALQVSRSGGWPQRVSLALERPWALATLGTELWIGCVGRLLRLER